MDPQRDLDWLETVTAAAVVELRAVETYAWTAAGRPLRSLKTATSCSTAPQADSDAGAGNCGVRLAVALRRVTYRDYRRRKGAGRLCHARG